MIMRNVVAGLLLLCCLLQEGRTFTPPILRTASSVSRTTLWQSDTRSVDSSESVVSSSLQLPIVLESHDDRDMDDDDDLLPLSSPLLPRKRGIRGFFYNRFAGLVTGLVGFVTEGIAADDYEYAELPPPYIPAIFGVVLLAGVGILTSSLGDVMDEEASLGLQSGARAKKEIERSRSSYFGKRR